MRIFAVFILCLCHTIVFAQNKYAVINGAVLDENDNPLKGVSIIILGKTNGIVSGDSGTFAIKVPAEKPIALVFSYTGFNPIQKNFFLSKDEIENIVIRLAKSGKTLENIVIRDTRERTESGLVKINPKNAMVLPSAVGGIEGLIKTLVGSNNELSSQYSVRGGNFDENLVYINDFEIYRPYLVSNGQQEGLSFINPELVKNINFYTGGFQSKYGDKMSSVLDIQYKKPSKFGGTAYMSLLEQGLHLEGALHKDKVTFIAGVRNRNNRNVLSNQPTLGSYIPSSSDFQSLITYKINKQWQLDLLGIFSQTKFTFYPESVKKTSSVFSPLFTANLGLDTYFEGLEKDSYNTGIIGATITHSPNDKLKLKWMLSRFKDLEKENFDITGAYLFGDRDFDRSSSSFGDIVNPLGAGLYQQYARNTLDIESWTAAHRGSYDYKNHFFQWGNSIEQTKIKDVLNQFEYQDSAGYSLPYNPSQFLLYNTIKGSADISVLKLSGYFQDNIHFNLKKSDITIQAGVRYNYNQLNKEMLISPRIQTSWKPFWKKDFVFRAAAGIYNQPPFYRELRKYDGTINTSIKSQKSLQFVGGMDYQFKGLNNRPFRLSAETYYKSIWDIIPYDIDNVKIKYLGNNDATAYATGVELRLFGELVKDAESWVSLGLMRTRENLKNDFYYDYTNAAGEIINAGTTDQKVEDSIKRDIGFVRRPADRLITIGLFLQDYLSTNKNFKVHLNMLYGSNMPYNIPNSTKYRNGLIVDSYLRIDLGFSALLLSEQYNRRSHSPFKNFENIWASLEIFNLINRANTISYQLIKDFANNIYAIPNRLTPRLVNLKLVARF